MKKLLLTVFTILLIAGAVKAQQLTPTTISTGGSSKLAGSVLLEDNVGGLMVSTISTSTFIYTQGFIQPDAGTTTVVLPINDVVLNSGAGIDNAGTTFINGNIMLEFTVGEVASKTLFGGTNMLTQGILQPYNTIVALPVTGLEFFAKRLDASKVVLDWKTLQEFNNKGFHMERKYENETNFTDIGFVPSTAFGGNSSLPLTYQKQDHNSFAGKTYYRIKQEDLDGKSTYSVIRIVAGAMDKQMHMQVWPVPANGPVNVLVNGLTKNDVLLLYDISGKLIKQQPVQNNSPIQLSGLKTGTYVLRLAENKELVQKIIVQ
jgi:Secretion system C-terminal sorting domain